MQNLVLSERIKTLCKQKRISVKSLLADCNMNRNTIYDLEKKGAFPSADKIHTLADKLDTTADYLLGRVESPYYILVNEHKCETYTINIGDFFNQNNNVSRYVSRLFEAFNEIYNVNTLLGDLLNNANNLPKNTNHIYIVFKYAIITLNEAFALLNPPENNKKYISAITELTINENIKREYDALLSILKDKPSGKQLYTQDIKFIRELRNLVAHYDHEKNVVYSDIVSSLHSCNLKLERNCLLYQNDFLFSYVITEIYRRTYNSTETTEKITYKVVKICANVLDLVFRCIREILNVFFETHDLSSWLHKDVLSNAKTPLQQVSLCTSSSSYNATENSNNTIHGSNNIIGNGNRVNEKLSKQETALLETFSKLDAFKQARLLTYLSELEKED